MADPNCPKCKGKGIITEKNGTVHTCWECLRKGTMDQHSKDLKDPGIKL